MGMSASEPKNFKVKGEYQETFRLILKVVDAHIDLTVQSVSTGQIAMWSSKEGPARHDYFVRGSFSSWQCVPMVADQDRSGVYRFQGQTDRNAKEFFNIVVDEDKYLVMYPEIAGTVPGRSVVAGPNDEGVEDYWEIACWQPGVPFEITLDLDAADKRNKVTLTWLAPQIDLDTMKAVVEQSFEE